MKQTIKFLLFFLLPVIGFSQSKVNENSKKNDFESIKFETLLEDKISIRSLIIDHDRVYYVANKNRFGYLDLLTKSKFERFIKNDTLQFEFRSMAETSENIFILNIGNPAVLYRFSKKSNDKKIVYQENNPKVFYDSMQFWDDSNGIAIGDPISDCLSVIITRDGGNTWNKIPCENLPKTFEGEAAFAASNTNIIVKDDQTWIVSGGKKARVFYSADKGNSWSVYNTPIVQGETMTGIFTADFYDEKTGIIAGGNYDKPDLNFGNKAITTNGGKTWKLVSENAGFGYASCVKYFPNSKGKKIISIGSTGIYYSGDKGMSWIKLSDEKDLYMISFINENVAIGAGKNKMVKLTFE